MKRSARIALLLAALLTVALGTYPAAPAAAAKPPENRVIVMYFHRTERCPTCQKMGAYAEEAVKTGFVQELKDGTVEFRDIDFQDQKNAAVAKGFKITGPALVMAKIQGNKLQEHKDLKEMWMKVREKPEFLQYVQENVSKYLR